VSESPIKKTSGKNFTAMRLDGWDGLDGCAFTHPGLPAAFPRKLFLKSELGLTGMEVSLNKLLPGEGMGFYHTHRANEECYIVLKGNGQFQVDGRVFEIGEGTVIRVAPQGVRAWRNNSSEALYLIVIQARAGGFSGENISDGKGAGAPVDWPE